MPDGAKKNLEVLRMEWRAWREVMRESLFRFRYADLRKGKNNAFHLAVNLVTESFRALPRTLSYLFVITTVIIIFV